MFSLERLCPNPKSLSLVLVDQSLDLQFSFHFQFPPSQGIGLSWVVRVWRGVALFLSLKEAYIPNLSLILCLAWKPNICFQFPPSRGIGLSAVVRLGMGVNSLALEKPTYQILASHRA